MRTGFVERYGKLTELDREFDLKFWQDQPAQARFDAAWELIVHAHRVKGGDVGQLRLQRSVETFQRQPGAGRPQDLLDVAQLTRAEDKFAKRRSSQSTRRKLK
jgi:hypothetical protein